MNAMTLPLRTRLAVPLCISAALLGACTQHAAAPAAGTAAPPAVAYASHGAAGGIVPPGGALHNPHAGDKGVAATGAQLFTAMNCDGCHGPDASGAVGPNLGDGRWRYGGADPEVFMSIYYGRPKGMPAFGGVLGEDGVWQLVTYLRSLPPPPNLPTQSWEKP
jgi:cytochrome c oxidase cbb3-type subunit III